MTKVYAIVDPRVQDSTLFLKGDKVTYKPNHFQVTSGDEVVGSFDYSHKLVDVDAINRPEPVEVESGE